MLLAVLFGIPLLILLAKLPGAPTAAAFTRTLSLEDLPARTQGRLEYVMLVPLSAVVVVFFRLTLGIRVFGLFRPILLAIAFRITGIELGLIFLAGVMASIVLVRPILRVKGLHSYARQGIALGAVVIVMLLTVVTAARVHWQALAPIASFPVVSLCLISEQFAKSLYDKGARIALWRGTMTIVAGVVICLISRIPGSLHFFLRFPELLIAQLGCVLAVTEFLDFRLCEKLHARLVTPVNAANPMEPANAFERCSSEVMR